MQLLIQDKLEEWKRQVVILDKDHTKEYKRCRNELKKRSSDTLRLQKKAKKGTSDNLQSLVDSSMQTVNQQKAELDDVERKSLRSAMIEDRTRYCQFVNMLQPVVKQEYEMMYELGHLQVIVWGFRLLKVIKVASICCSLIFESDFVRFFYDTKWGGRSQA